MGVKGVKGGDGVDGRGGVPGLKVSINDIVLEMLRYPLVLY